MQISVKSVNITNDLSILRLGRRIKFTIKFAVHENIVTFASPKIITIQLYPNEKDISAIQQKKS